MKVSEGPWSDSYRHFISLVGLHSHPRVPLVSRRRMRCRAQGRRQPPLPRSKARARSGNCKATPQDEAD